MFNTFSVSEVHLFETTGGGLIAVCGADAFTDLEFSSEDFQDDAAAIMAGAVDDWTLPIVPTEQVAEIIAHAETKLIAVYDENGIRLYQKPGANGLEALSLFLLGESRRRVQVTPELAGDADLILGDWPEAEAHWWWVATAPVAKILAWVADCRR